MAKTEGTRGRIVQNEIEVSVSGGEARSRNYGVIGDSFSDRATSSTFEKPKGATPASLGTLG